MRRDAGANAGRRRWPGRHSYESSETECGGTERGGGARNRLDHHSRNSENHLTYAEALRQSGYQGDNGVVVLSKKMSAARVRGEMNLVADAFISMSQTQGKKVARIEEEGVDS